MQLVSVYFKAKSFRRFKMFVFAAFMIMVRCLNVYTVT